MKKFLFLMASCATVALSANIGPYGFHPFLNDYFVETGTFGGGGIYQALKAGFKQVRSIDTDYRHINYVKDRFSGLSNIKLYVGDSGEDLWKMIEDIQSPITFWLDAHIYPPREDGGKNCPLMQELEQIKRHPIKTHTILIDDMFCCGQKAFDFLTKEEIVAKILEINPNYSIRYIAGGDDGECPESILVAQITQ